MKKLKFIFNPSELGAGSRGAGLGPDAIRTASFKYKSKLFTDIPHIRLKDYNDAVTERSKTPNARHINKIVNVLKQTANAVSSVLLREKCLPVVLSGDHSSAAGTIAGIKKAYPQKRLGVVWIDAHADLHSPYTSPSGNLHGMPLGIALGHKKDETAVNILHKTTKKAWEDLVNIGGPGPKILPSDLVYVAVRDTEEQENSYIARHKIRTIKVKEVKRDGGKKTADAISEYLKKCDLLYISFDVDSLDPKAASSGTGTPVRGGLAPGEAEELVVQLCKNKKTCCVEITEVNPLLDIRGNLTAEIAFNLLEKVVRTLKKQK